MPRQDAPTGSRSDTRQFNTAMEQVAQFYESPAARNAAFGIEDIPDTLITHVAEPENRNDRNRWQRHDGDAWVPAFLEEDFQVGWKNALVETDRSMARTLTATVELSRPVPAGVTYTVQYQSADGTAKVSEGDYTAIPLTTLVFMAGEQEKQVSIQVAAAVGKQPAEEFYVDLLNPSAGTLNHGIGRRLTVTLSGDTSDIIFAIADASVAEGSGVAVAASISREVSGDFQFNYSTRAATGLDAAPAALYTSIASATGTIPEGSTSVNVNTQTVEVAGATNIEIQKYEIVVPQNSLAVVGGDLQDHPRIAASGHDLVSEISVTRNEYVAPNSFVSLPPFTDFNAANYLGNLYIYDPVAFRLIPRSSYRFPAPTDPPGDFSRATRISRGTWPRIRISGTISPAAVLPSHWFYTASMITLGYGEVAHANFPVLFTRSGRIDVAVGATSWTTDIALMPDESDAPPGATSTAIYTRSEYTHLWVVGDAAQLFRLDFERPFGIQFEGGAATLSRTYPRPA